MKTIESLSVRARAATDVGGRRSNEDAYLINEDLCLFIVADGMGGHDKGEVASWFTSESLEAIVSSSREHDGHVTLDHDMPTPGESIDADRLMEYAVMTINRKLYELNEREIAKAFPSSNAAEMEAASMLGKRRRMGTTLVSFLIQGNRAYLTHVGDSRAYRIAGGAILQLTHDHSWVEEQIREGKLTTEEARTHEKRNVITRSVGFRREVEADIDVLILNPPERFLLCSDGLSNVVSNEDLLFFGQMDDLDAACERMIEAAKSNGGRDNITAVLVDVSRSAEGGELGKADDEFGEFTDL